jgi:hypothetical protein
MEDMVVKTCFLLQPRIYYLFGCGATVLGVAVCWLTGGLPKGWVTK